MSRSWIPIIELLIRLMENYINPLKLWIFQMGVSVENTDSGRKQNITIALEARYQLQSVPTPPGF